MKSLAEFNAEATHSAQLSSDSSVTTIRSTMHPDRWLVVARLTSGYLFAYPGSSRGTLSVKLDRGTIVLPLHGQEFSIETVGASGWWSVYAVRDLEEIEVTA